jgi:hypothetical protein
MKSKIIAVQEELLQKSEWEMFLKSSAVRVAILSRRQLTLELSNEMHNRFQYSNFHAVHGVPSGVYPNKYDLYLFAPENFQEAKDFSIRNSRLKVVVVSTPDLELKYEDAGNFSVRTWQYISSYIAELRGIKPKEVKQKITPSPNVVREAYKIGVIPEVKIRRWSEPEVEENTDGSIIDEIEPSDQRDEPPREY